MSFGASVGVFLALGFVLILLGIALKLLQRMSPGATRRGRLPMQVVQRLSLGPKQGIAVVRIGERHIAVTVGDGGVNRLFQLEADEVACFAPEPERAAGDVGASNFRVAFKTALRTAGVPLAIALVMVSGASIDARAQSAASLAALARNVSNGGPTSLASVTAALPSSGFSLQRPAAATTQSGTNQQGASVQQLMQAAQMLQGVTPGGRGQGQGSGAATAQGLAASLQGLANSAAAAGATASGSNTSVASAGATMAVSKLAPQLDLRVGNGGAGTGGDGGLRLSGTVGIVVMMGLLTLLPTLLLMMTSFTRILIVLSFLRTALGTQNAPPANLLAAMALLLTGFVMAPTMNAVNRDAIQPWMDGKIEQGEMLSRGSVPFRAFMLRQTRDHDLQVFVDMSAGPRPATTADVPLVTLMSAFVTSELRTSFQIGFALFLPFIIIDVVVSSVLMSMGMFMLPPAMISLPFKLLLFVLVDGWTLIVQSLVTSFR